MKIKTLLPLFKKIDPDVALKIGRIRFVFAWVKSIKNSQIFILIPKMHNFYIKENGKYRKEAIF